MFLFDCLLLAVFIYLTPALALFPRLLLNSSTVFGLPVISAAVIYCLVTLLEAFGIYQGQSVQLSAVALGFIAALRVRATIKQNPLSWDRTHIMLWLFIICLMLPFFMKAGTQAFERGDEIYSWNFWALQHYFQEPLDFSHTGATYPQLFPKLISFCYHLLGSIQLQCPVKAMLVMFSMALVGAWASMLMRLTPKRWVYFLVIVAYVLGGLKLEQFFNDGYADPIMSSALVVSMAYLLLAFEVKAAPQTSLAWLSVIAAAVACYAKQPALLWLIAILPCVLLAKTFKYKKMELPVAAFVSVALAVLWLFTEGNQFYNNQGVIYLSFEGRGWVEQFLHVSHRYLIQNPLLLILFVVAGYKAHTNKTTRFVFWAFIVPQLVLWLMFGAYQLRLGQHVIAASTLLLAFGLKRSHFDFRLLKQLRHSLVKRQQYWLTGMAALSSFACIAVLTKAWYVDKPGVDFYQGGRVSLVRYFGNDAQKVYDQIYLNPNALLWVPTRYIYGIFYKHTRLTSPDYSLYSPYTEQALVTELRQKQPDYVFTVSPEVIDGPASHLLGQVIAQCPAAFHIFATPPNKFNYTTYQVNKLVLEQDPCLTQLMVGKA